MAASCRAAARACARSWCRSRSASSPRSRRGISRRSPRSRKIAGALGAGLRLDHQGLGRNAGRLRRTGQVLRRCRPAGGRAAISVFGVPAQISEHLVSSDIVRKISFTGSIPVGKHLAGLAAKGMKRATMELGGHSPVVVFDDSDPEKAADTIAAFKYRNAGQVCISPTRFYVQEKGYNKFVARFTEYAKGLKLGDGLEKSTTLGPAGQSAPSRCHGILRQQRQGARRQDPDRRQSPRQPGLLLRADRGHRCAG